jgi:predicted MarR family transcription regulator
MLSGEPFTIEELKRTFSSNEEQAYSIELRLRKFQREGLIEFKRQGLHVTWFATAAGKRKLKEIDK